MSAAFHPGSSATVHRDPIPNLRRRKSITRSSNGLAGHTIRRRLSHDEIGGNVPSFLVPVDKTLQALAVTEDTDRDGRITVDDDGPKNVILRSLNSDGRNGSSIRGTYAVSNLYQDLSAAKDKQQRSIEMRYNLLHENPVERLSHLIKDRFWVNLSRRLDVSTIVKATHDTKRRADDQMSRLYVPSDATVQLSYYRDMARKRPELNLVVESLPSKLTHETYMTLTNKPGLLALDADYITNPSTGQREVQAVPFVVPGGWFNEFFGWDSYFISLGLLIDGKTDLVKNVIRNWVFEIQHYGLIPNANRSYLMLRSQPPFLTDLCVRLYRATSATDPEAKQFLEKGIKAAIKEYHSVWMNSPRLDKETGLSRYRPNGIGIPPEVALDYYAPFLKPYAQKHGLTLEELAKRFNSGEIKEPELDTYFLHDRGARESGHDTQNRLENKTADLAIIDLNCLLYKFETDIAHILGSIFNESLEWSEESSPYSQDELRSSVWTTRAKTRTAAIDKYLWNEDKGIYVDYNTRTKQQEPADSVTCLWALWCGVASPHQASLLVSKGLPLFECVGGLASSSKATGFSNVLRLYQCQWDYPHGWAPHQMLAWEGLARYGYHAEAARLAYKWLFTVLKVFVDHSGAVLEKYDVTKTVDPHHVDTEYPNQGLKFEGYAKEGFGWTNASFTYGLGFVDKRMRRALGIPAPYGIFAGGRSS